MTTAFRIIFCGILVAVAIGCDAERQAAQTPAESATRIGIYDSRAIAVAFAGTEAFRAEMAELEAAYAKANAAGNEQRMAELEAEAEDRQHRLHRQGFGTAPVDNILACIADELPAIKADASVTALVSKWDAATLAKYPTAERIDVTMALVDALAPTDKQRQVAIEIQAHEPVASDED